MKRNISILLFSRYFLLLFEWRKPILIIHKYYLQNVHNQIWKSKGISLVFLAQSSRMKSYNLIIVEKKKKITLINILAFIFDFNPDQYNSLLLYISMKLYTFSYFPLPRKFAKKTFLIKFLNK